MIWRDRCKMIDGVPILEHKHIEYGLGIDEPHHMWLKSATSWLGWYEGLARKEPSLLNVIVEFFASNYVHKLTDLVTRLSAALLELVDQDFCCLL